MVTDIRVAVVVPNLNGADFIAQAIDSLLHQTFKASIIVIENASIDNSLEILKSYKDQITIIQNEKNLGFAGGVNVGIRYALDNSFDAVALFNNDAVADPSWLSELVTNISNHHDTGIVTSRILLSDDGTLDSTGEFYTTWGLPYPRGRKEPENSYEQQEYVFGASGGASLYQTKLFRDIGLFDETFFAYYEDTDISFRAQLAGWKIRYTPTALVKHRQGATSKKMTSGFTVYQTFKNLPILFTKNIPTSLLFSVGIRFYFAYFLIFAKAITAGNAWPALKGIGRALRHLPHSIKERWRIQHSKRVSAGYINEIIIHDLPPNQTGIRKLRGIFIRKQ